MPCRPSYISTASETSVLLRRNGKSQSQYLMPYISTGIILIRQFNWKALSCAFSNSIFPPSYLNVYIMKSNISVRWNICDCIFHCAAQVLSSSVCHFCISEVLQSRVQAIPSSFYFGHKLKLSLQPKSIFLIFTTNPSHPPWLITNALRFICSTSCGYEPKVAATSSSQRSQLPSNLSWYPTVIGARVVISTITYFHPSLLSEWAKSRDLIH
jgi:hypothetical protein